MKRCFAVSALGLLLVVDAGRAAAQRQSSAAPRFVVTLPKGVIGQPSITGRAFVFITRRVDVCDTRSFVPDESLCPAKSVHREPRLQAGAWENSVPFFGADVNALRPGESAILDAGTLGYPAVSLRDIPPGDYYVQALLNVYTQFPRADGHTVWLHEDQWEGQKFNTAPGNLVSEVQRVHLDARNGYSIALSLTKVLPPVQVPSDNDEVKRIRIQSRLLTAFWGRPIFLGAVVLLPKGYTEHPDLRYPVVYQQGHFSLGAPFGHTHVDTPESNEQRKVRLEHNRETSYELSRAWDGPDFPRMVAVTFQHPTPYYDDSYAVNSANNGPYGDAIMTELIPEIERRFRIIQKPYARVLTGGSTGGWEALALQVYHPEFFGGTWPMYPDPVDFHSYGLLDIYADSNAFIAPHHEWITPERYWMRDHWMHAESDGQPTITMRAMNRMEDVLGSHGRSSEQLAVWETVYGPVGADGYFKPLWDSRTGTIDRSVALYMRDHGYDLTHYLRENWGSIGAQLVGKLHVSVGDMDQFYLNNAVYRLEQFLESTRDPYYAGSFTYGRPKKNHGWQPKSTGGILREMAQHIVEHAPAGEQTAAWRY